MIVLDTSAVVAIVANEPEGAGIATVAGSEMELWMSTGTGLELAIVAQSKWGPVGIERVDGLLREMNVRYRSVDENQMRLAKEAYGRFGRGTGHPAKLNFGDCFSYALAKSLDAPLLYKGDDFSRTDIRSAIAA